MFSPAIVAGMLAGVALISFGAGFMVESWRSDAEIERISGQNTMLSTAKDKCAADVRNARSAMEQIDRANRELEKRAAEAMREAGPEVEKRTTTITKILAMPQVEIDQQCEAIKEEQIKYVQARRK